MMASMPTRQLGKNGPFISAIGFGAMGLSGFYGNVLSDEEQFKIIDRVIELGSTHIDTADVYGESEVLLGKYFKKYPYQREKVFLSTKFGNVKAPDGKHSVRGDAQYVREANAKSLQRLDLDSVDLYYAHEIDTTVPIEETMGALKELATAGKVKNIGLCKCSCDTLRRAYAVHPIAAIQIEYSPFSMEIEHEDIGLLKTCRELNVAIVCFSPLGRGLLSGQIKSPADFVERDYRKISPRYSEENFPKNLQLIETLTSAAKKKGCTPAQLTLAWILAQGEDLIPIPGTTKIKNLEENSAAAQIKLSNEEINAIRQASEKADVTDEPYPKAFNARVFADSAPKKN